MLDAKGSGTAEPGISSKWGSPRPPTAIVCRRDREAELRRGDRLRAFIAVSLLCLGSLVGAAIANAAPALRDGAGLQVSSVRQLDSRLTEATLTTTALPGPA